MAWGKACRTTRHTARGKGRQGLKFIVGGYGVLARDTRGDWCSIELFSVSHYQRVEGRFAIENRAGPLFTWVGLHIWNIWPGTKEWTTPHRISM